MKKFLVGGLVLILAFLVIGCDREPNKELNEESVAIPNPFELVDEYISDGRLEDALDLLKEIGVANPELESECLKRQAMLEERLSEIEQAEIKAAEAARQEAVAEAASIIRIVSVRTSRPNSAGGVDLFIHWQNTSDKVVKYCTFVVQPYNAVDDPVYCEIRGNSQFRGQETGPVKPGQHRGNDGTRWECAWYNSTITYAKIVRVEIEYMDGSTVNVNGEYLVF